MRYILAGLALIPFVLGIVLSIYVVASILTKISIWIERQTEESQRFNKIWNIVIGIVTNVVLIMALVGAYIIVLDWF